MLNKKGAMFGLDARIALAIFGALSVISGAALYSAIKVAKTEQWRQYFVEMVKATESYYLDNGQILPRYNSYGLYLSDVVNNRESLSTWKGPYISYDSFTNEYIKDKMTKQIGINAYTKVKQKQASDWTEMNDVFDENCVANDTDCTQWIYLYAGDALYESKMEQLFADLDALIDNSDGQLKGIVRHSDDAFKAIYYKSIPSKKI
jgi:type II secretory pathway pseudopilin PulG